MKKIFVFGDSHSRFFKPINEARILCPQDLKKIDIEVHAISAASIKGFGKRNSKLGVSKIIKEKINKSGGLSDTYLVLAFGQVDVELGFYYSKFVKKDCSDFNVFLNGIIGTYLDFIEKNFLNKIRVIVKGVNLPVLVYDREKAIKYTKKIIMENTNDKELIESVVSDMNLNFPSSLERTKQHLDFNASLRSCCRRLGIGYFDVNDYIMEEDGSLIATSFVPSSDDHHLVDSVSVRSFHMKELLLSCN